MQKALFFPSQPEPDYHVNPARDSHFEEGVGGGAHQPSRATTRFSECTGGGVKISGVRSSSRPLARHLAPQQPMQSAEMPPFVATALEGSIHKRREARK